MWPGHKCVQVTQLVCNRHRPAAHPMQVAQPPRYDPISARDSMDELREQMLECQVDGRLGRQYVQWCHEQPSRLSLAVSHLRSVCALVSSFDDRQHLAERAVDLHMSQLPLLQPQPQVRCGRGVGVWCGACNPTCPNCPPCFHPVPTGGAAAAAALEVAHSTGVTVGATGRAMPD